MKSSSATKAVTASAAALSHLGPARMGMLLTLYIAQGVPIGFISQALPVIQRKYGASLILISWTGILLLPAALKFLWAPFVDRYYQPQWGQSRSWIIPLQLLSAGLVAGMGFLDPAGLGDLTTALGFFALIFAVALIGATHDIAADALATRLATGEQRRYANAMQVGGYRLGIILGGGVILMLLDILSWQWVFWSMSLLILVNTIPIWFFREPDWRASSPSVRPPAEHNLLRWLKREFGYFWQSAEMRAWFMVLLVFKVADGLSSVMVRPMMKDMQFNFSQIGLWGSIAGSGASIVGAGIAILAMRYLDKTRALIAFNLLQALTTGCYALVAWQFEHDHWLLPKSQIFAVNAIEHAAASMALVAMLTLIMDYARQHKAGSDFTFQVCVMTFLGGFAHFLGGNLAQAAGYTWHFAISGMIGVMLLLPLLNWQKHYRQKRQSNN